MIVSLYQQHWGGGKATYQPHVLPLKWLHIINKLHYNDQYLEYVESSIDIFVASCDYVRVKNEKLNII